MKIRRIGAQYILLSALGPLVTLSAHAQTQNLGTGTGSMIAITTGSYNTGTGFYAVRWDQTGSNNTGTGRGALFTNPGGNDNTATGTSALYSNTASANTADGSSALSANTTGTKNVAVGFQALLSATMENENVAVGYRALASSNTNDNASGFNTAVGSSAMENGSGSGNVAIGWQAMRNGGGNYQVAVGDDALALGGGGACVAVGATALQASQGLGNSALGFATLGRTTSGVLNTGMGAYALQYNTTGSRNTAVGEEAANYTTDTTLSNTGAFGYQAMPTESNMIRLGNSSVAKIGGYAPWSNLSDARFKTNVKENVPGLAFVTKLRPVTFSWNMEKLKKFDGVKDAPTDAAILAAEKEKSEKQYTGFLAQEVEVAANQAQFDFSGVLKPANDHSHYELSYAEFVVPLVRSVQEQQKEIQDLQGVVATLRNGGGSPKHAGLVGDSNALSAALLGALATLVLVRRGKTAHG